MQKIEPQLRWYSKKETIGNPELLRSFLFVMVGEEEETQDITKNLLKKLPYDDAGFFNFPERINQIQFRMLFFKSHRSLDLYDLAKIYRGLTANDSNMYYAYKDGDVAGLRNYVHRDILKISPKPKKTLSLPFF